VIVAEVQAWLRGSAIFPARPGRWSSSPEAAPRPSRIQSAARDPGAREARAVDEVVLISTYSSCGGRELCAAIRYGDRELAVAAAGRAANHEEDRA
jgi:hypothetical protein